jgi:hypothetical protein
MKLLPRTGGEDGAVKEFLLDRMDLRNGRRCRVASPSGSQNQSHVEQMERYAKLFLFCVKPDMAVHSRSMDSGIIVDKRSAWTGPKSGNTFQNNTWRTSLSCPRK